MGATGWSIVESRGLRVARCDLLDLPGLGHAFSTRDVDLGAGDEADPAVLRKRQRLGLSAGVSGMPVVVRQVHGRRILRAVDATPGSEADGLLAGRADPGSPVPAVRVADCVPVLLVGGAGRAAAALHAGWRGTASGILKRAVSLLRDQGIAPSSVRAALGPAIGGCCYEVGPEVAGQVAAGTGVPVGDLTEKSASGRPLLDLRRANRLQLESAGVLAESISTAPWCTVCDADLFFSYRREGARAGRMMALIGWSPPP